MFVLFLKGIYMNKLLLFLMLLSGAVFGQSRLGSTKSEIYSEFSDLSPQFGVNEDGTTNMSVGFDRSFTRYFFNERNVCDMVILIPLRTGDLNYYVELYNSRYVVVSSTSWRMYSKDGAIASIELMTSEGVTMFVWRVVG